MLCSVELKQNRRTAYNRPNWKIMRKTFGNWGFGRSIRSVSKPLMLQLFIAMELLTYSILLNFPETLPYSAVIQTKTVKFLENVPNAILISNNLTSWNDVKFPFLLSLRNFDTAAKQTTHAYIIDLRDRKQPHKALSALPRNTNTRFVFIITEENSLYEMPHFCHALFLMITDNDLRDKVSVDHCKGIGSITIKGHDCTANVSFLDFPPNVIFNGKELDGTEGKMFQTAADYLGLHLNYINRHEKGWGQFDPPSGLQGDIATKSSLAAFGALYTFIERANYSEVVYGDSLTSLSWAVPKGVGPSQPTWYILLITEFSTTVWILTLFTYGALIPIANFLKTDAKENVLLNILGLILGNPQKLILKRTLSFNIIIFGFLLTSYYRTMMSSKLTVPAKATAIHTTKELVESGLQLLGPPSAAKILSDGAEASPEDEMKALVVENYIPTLADLNEILPKIVDEKTIAYLRHEANINYHAHKYPRYAGQIHIVEEPASTYYPATLFSKHSCLAARFQVIYLHLCGGGLSSKWTKDLTNYHKVTSKALRKLDLQHIKGVVFLLLFGCVVSFVSLISELAYFYIRKKITKISAVNELQFFLIRPKKSENFP